MFKVTWIGGLLVAGLTLLPCDEAKAAGETKPVPAPVAPLAAPAKPAEPAVSAEAAAAAARDAQRKIDIEAAQARCTTLLKSIHAVAIPKDPIEEGDCGSLAPVELVSVGKNPEVALSPPAILNCDMVVALHDWIKADVQPIAKKHLGREVVRLETMSSYSCRNAYGRKMSKLSEHGKANALDIRGFVTAKGDTAYVLEDWGLTSGEIKAAAAAAQKEQAARELAVAQAKAEAEAQARAIAAAKAKAGGTATAAAQPAAQQPANPLANATTIVEGIGKPALSLGATQKGTGTDLGLTQSSKLGGPKKPAETAAHVRPETVAAAPASASPNDAVAAAKSQFLRELHATACRRFGTTLGPESNAAHRNHFHVDLAERKSKSICE